MPSRWWTREGVAERFVRDIVAHEWSRLRPTWTAPFHDLDDLHADSLEIVALASALNTALHLHESGVEDSLLARRTLADWAAIARAGLDEYSASLTFATSGSVDEPKRCTHSLATLWQEAELLGTMFGGRTRVLSAVRSHHIYGFLFTVLLPELLGIDAVVDIRGQLPSSIQRQLREGDLIVGYPDFWAAFVASGVSIPAGVVGSTSTAPCPDDVARGVLQSGCEALVQVYGSTETAGVGARRTSDAPFELFPFWERIGDALIRLAPDGSRSPHELPDRLEWCGDREFVPRGRVDEAIQVAGVNVFPSRVRRVLMEHPSVADAAVRRANGDALGRLKAFIVPRGADDVALLERELTTWVDMHLAVPERPRVMSFGAQLPRDEAGKACDWDVRA